MIKKDFFLFCFLFFLLTSCTSKIVGTFCGGEGKDYLYLELDGKSKFKYYVTKPGVSKGVGLYSINRNALLLNFSHYPLEEIHKDSIIYTPTGNDSIVIDIIGSYNESIPHKEWCNLIIYMKINGEIIRPIEYQNKIHADVLLVDNKKLSLFKGIYTDSIEFQISTNYSRKSFFDISKPGKYTINYPYVKSKDLSIYDFHKLNDNSYTYFEVVEVKKDYILLYMGFDSNKSFKLYRNCKDDWDIPYF